MDKKEMKRGKKPSLSDDAPAPRSWDEGRRTSASEFFERLNQAPMNHGRHDAQKELTSSEFLELLKKQGPESQVRHGRTMNTDGSCQGSSNKGQSSQNKDRNQNYHSVAIDQCDITSSVDYGSRDYYCPTAHSSDTPYTRKENELDDVYKTTDTRGNWWQGSFYY